MERKHFLRLLAGTFGAMTLSSFKNLTDELQSQEHVMPVFFIGHGSPMNAIETNSFSETWRKLPSQIPLPRAVLCISAHWLTRGTSVTAMAHPKTIHDFGGFPQALFDVQYPAPGSPELAAETQKLITSTKVEADHDWGLDHGTWSIIKQMYPDAKIPVFQLSIDYYKPAAYHYALAKELAQLRRKGVLIVGSGNMVHNLGMVDFARINDDDYGYDWAHEMNTIFKDKINKGDHTALMNYETLNKAARLAIPTPDHYYPLIYSLGLQEKRDHVSFFNDKAVAGSLTMTSVRIDR
ncbi:MAG: 4,5-DOPA dioxygenase extradiol [Bacteroidetes bacterium]|nr:4,5-DOPA dioxygenase extradiol [Bacteroidota bacterium]